MAAALLAFQRWGCSHPLTAVLGLQIPMVLRRPQRLDKYAQFFPKSRTGCPTAEPVESFCTSQPVRFRPISIA